MADVLEVDRYEDAAPHMEGVEYQLGGVGELVATERRSLFSSMRPSSRRKTYTNVGWKTRVSKVIDIAPPITTMARGR